MTRYNSTLQRKHCNCSTSCERWPTFGLNGRNYNCLTDVEKQVIGTRNKIAQKQKAYNNTQSRMLHIAQNKANGDTEKAELWFRSKRHKMTGWCACGCGLTSSKNDNEYWKFSAAHIMAKSKFKSIAWHPDNWVELNFWEGHHTTFDNMGYEYCKTTKPILWKIVVEKFRILYEFISPDEMKHIPTVLLETLVI